MDVERLKVDESLWPEWATHAGRYGKRRVCWYADIDDNGNAVHPDGYRFKYSGTSIPVCRNPGKVSHFDLIPRPTKTEWTPERQAMKTLESMGYTYCGGEYWKPPIGEKPEWLETEWVDGVPPEGAECEVDHSRDDLYVRCYVHGKSVLQGEPEKYVYEVLEGIHKGVLDAEPSELFRQIRTPEQRRRDELIKVILDNVDKKEFASTEWAEHARRVIDQSVDAILQWMKDKEK